MQRGCFHVKMGECSRSMLSLSAYCDPIPFQYHLIHSGILEGIKTCVQKGIHCTFLILKVARIVFMSSSTSESVLNPLSFKINSAPFGVLSSQTSFCTLPPSCITGCCPPGFLFNQDETRASAAMVVWPQE